MTVHTKLGRYQVPEPLSALIDLHHHDATVALKTADHEPKVGVLDQEDLVTQGILTSTFIPGCTTNAAALGSCTCNTDTEALSNVLPEEEFAKFVADLGAQEIPSDPYGDVVAAERAAIGTYHAVTDQTGDSSSEWPPTDCGSSGPYLYEWTLKQGLIKSQAIAHGATNIVSLMQTDGLLVGLPWFNAWFEPNAQGFVDGNGSTAALRAAIKSQVAGGHEIYFSAVETLGLTHSGEVIPSKTVIRFRNHWTKSWGDNGSGRFHLSTIIALGGNVDLRQFRA